MRSGAKKYPGWTRRDWNGQQYAYWWVDGIDTTLRESDDPRLCLLVIIGVTGDCALGFWAAWEKVYPDTVPQRCWLHTMGDVLAADLCPGEGGRVTRRDTLPRRHSGD